MIKALPAGLRRGWSLFAAVLLVAGVLPLLAAQPAIAQTPDTAALTVRKGGDRTGEQTVAPLAGAVFDFYAGVSGTRPGPGDVPVDSCTTGADGTCTVEVPGRTGTNQGYWIIERSAPAGWRLIETLDTGGTTTTPTTYNGIFTGAVANDQAYVFPVVTTGNTNRTARGSQWADARDNPSLPAQCGLHIALLIDVSGSISPFLNDVKAAANGFVDALTGTPSEIALFRFSSTAATVLNPTPVSDQSGANTVKGAINGLTAGGATNWDEGLFQVANSGFTFDAVIFLTDGNPTVYGPPPVQGPGNFTRFREVEEGVFSANAVKGEGARIIAVGVGAGVSGSANNLAAVSGPVAGSDYFQTDFDELAALLREIALENCAGTISVVKKVIPPGGTPADALPTGGWTISTSTPDVTPPSGVTDTSTGAVSFDVDLGGQQSRPVTLTETLQAGYTLVQQAGDNAACTANGQAAPVTNSGPLGFTVDAQANGIVSCVILNLAPDPVASVVVNKTWIINGVTYQDPAQPAEFESALQLTDIVEPAWGVEYHDYTAGQTVTIGEQATVPPGCTNEPSGDLGEQVLDSGLNTYAVTNTVTCVTRLRLTKLVDNPYGPPEPAATEWTLNAFPPGSGTPVISGPTGVIGPVAPGVTYSLGESSVPGFTQTVAPGAVIVPPATGSWECRVVLRGGAPAVGVYDGTNGTVAVQIGQTVVCTATNVPQPARLTLIKEVDNQFGGDAEPGDWLLSATPPPGSGATPVSGRFGEQAIVGATVNPNVPYTLAESAGPAGYEQVGEVRCVLAGTQQVIETPNQVLTPSFGQNIVCTFTNTDIQPRLTLVKEVSGGDAEPGDWTLTATPAGGGTPISGPSGSPAVTNAPARSNVGYALTESGPPGYEEGTPTCVLTGTQTPVPVTDRVVTLGSGQNVTCTFHNTAQQAHLTLVKVIKKQYRKDCAGRPRTDGDGGSGGGLADGAGRDGMDGTGRDGMDGGWKKSRPDSGSDGGTHRPCPGKDRKVRPSDFILTATPDNGGAPISGPSGSPAVTNRPVTPGVGYTLTESGPRGYVEVGDPTCVLTGTQTPVPVVDRVVTPRAGQNITCVFVNRAKSRHGDHRPDGHDPGGHKPGGHDPGGHKPDGKGWHDWRLPRTGTPVAVLAGGGGATVLAGVALLVIARRRRREDDLAA